MAYRDMTVRSDEWEVPGAVISTLALGEVELTIEFETEAGEPYGFRLHTARVNGKQVDHWLDAAMHRWVAENQAELTQRYYDKERIGEWAE